MLNQDAIKFNKKESARGIAVKIFTLLNRKIDSGNQLYRRLVDELSINKKESSKVYANTRFKCSKFKYKLLC